MDIKSEEVTRKSSDLKRVCEEQRQKIVALERKLKEKESEVNTLNTALRKYSYKEVHRGNPGFAITPQAKPVPVASDFWDSHVEGGEGTDFTFEDIAAKGLWILSSERQPMASQSLKRPSDSHISPIIHRKPTPYHPSPVLKSTPPSQFPPERVSYTHLNRIKQPTFRLPELKPGKGDYKSVSPVKYRPLPQSNETNRIKETGYPLSQGQLRSALQRNMPGKLHKIQPSPEKQRMDTLKGRKVSYDSGSDRRARLFPTSSPKSQTKSTTRSPLRPRRDPIRTSISLKTHQPTRRG